MGHSANFKPTFDSMTLALLGVWIRKRSLVMPCNHQKHSKTSETFVTTVDFPTLSLKLLSLDCNRKLNQKPVI